MQGGPYLSGILLWDDNGREVSFPGVKLLYISKAYSWLFTFRFLRIGYLIEGQSFLRKEFSKSNIIMYRKF